MAEGDYQPEPYRRTIPLEPAGERYEYRKQTYSKPVSYGTGGYEKAPAGADNIGTLFKADRYITGQMIESIIGMIGVCCSNKKKIQAELNH
jgi:hypothetical protein